MQHVYTYIEPPSGCVTVEVHLPSLQAHFSLNLCIWGTSGHCDLLCDSSIKPASTRGKHIQYIRAGLIPPRKILTFHIISIHWSLPTAKAYTKLHHEGMEIA